MGDIPALLDERPPGVPSGVGTADTEFGPEWFPPLLVADAVVAEFECDD